MFNWAAIPDSLDNNYEEAESTSPSISSSSASFALQNSHAQMLTRSASTSHISSSSSHLDPMSHPISSSSHPHQRTPGAGSLSEFSSPVTTTTTKLLSTKSAGEQINGGLKAPPNSTFDTLTGVAGALGGAGQPSLLDPPASNSCWWYSRKSASLPDFVLISEFSEVEGPRAVMTIPDNIVDLTRDSYSSNKQRQELSPGKSQPQHMQDLSDSTLGPESNSAQEKEDVFDIHEFVLRITSVDQQAREASGSFHIPEDIEVHISDSEKGYWAYVHHFTLFDINARGFVRPFCMSYITRDPHKILAHYEEMRHKFSKAALHFKTGNYMLFRQDLTKKLRDLNFTNNLLSEAPPEQSKSSDASSSTTPTPVPSASQSISNLQYESVATPPSSSTSSPPAGTPPQEQTMPSTTSHDTITASPSIDHSESPLGTMTETQKEDLESIKDAIETATHIISTLEHYSVDGQPLLGHADDGNEVAPTAPLSDLSPMTSSENLALLAAGRTGPTDPSLFLGATSRPGARIRHKASTSNVPGAMTSRMHDSQGPTAHMDSLSAALPPHLLGLQEQSRKNSVVSEYDSMMYETPEYEAQYVTTLYPIFRDEVTFRPLRELCIATMVWNSSIHFHLGVKKIKDILRDFQADSQLLGEASDSIKRMYPTSTSLTVGQRFMMNFRNPNFNRTSTRQTNYQPSSVPFMELLEGISLANAPPLEDGLSTMLKTVDTTPGIQGQEVELMVETADTPRMQAPTLDADDADDEETGYDSLDDAASFFTAATGVATHNDTPTREAFVISPLDRSSRVAEWHQEQQTIHRAKGGTPQEGSQGHGPWTFGDGVTVAEAVHGPSRFYRSHRSSAQSGTSIGVTGAPSLQSTNCPTIILDTLQRDPSLAKHLVFALLSGQRLCVMGQTESEPKVRTLVSVLSTFLPHAGFPSKEEQLIEHQHQIVTWFQGPGLLRLEDMNALRLVGVDSGKIEPKFLESDTCILDYDTLTWVHGQQYSDGVILESIFRNMSHFSDDISFLAFVDGKLFEVLLKSFLYYHLVFHGRLYQGGSLLALPGTQSFYSSGASDDGEAFSYQNNFRSSKQSPMMPKNSGLSRSHRKNTSTYPASTQLGATASYKNLNSRTLSLSSYESSDTEKMTPRSQDHRNGARDYGDDSRYPQYEHREGMDMEEDEVNQSGGPMQYTTSQGMRKWKKWFEYWSAKSAAMIDPALAAFGRSDSTAHIDSSNSNRRKRNTSGRASSGYASPQQHPQPQQQNRRIRISSNHTSPGRSREAKERDKERDRERDRERSRKSTFDPFDVAAKEKASYSDYDSDLRGTDEKDAEKEAMALSLQSQDPQQVKIEEAHDTLAQALTPMSSSLSKDIGAVTGLRKLKPKRPLTLSRPLSKSSDREQGKSDAESASSDRKLQRSLSSGSASRPSPPPSASFRSLAGALRAMSFGQSSTSKDNVQGTESRDDLPTLAASGLSAEPSPRPSREHSDSNSKDIKRRGSARAKAKAWLKSKRKRRSRIDGGELEQEGASTGGSRHSSEVMRKSNLSEEDEVGSFASQSYGSDTEDQEYRPRQLFRHHTHDPKIASRSLQDNGALDQNKDQDPLSQATDGAMTGQVVPPEKPEELPLTIEEIAAQEPTRIQSRPPPSSNHSPSPMTAVFGHSSSSNNSSRISSANASRITSPTLTASLMASQRLPHSQQQKGGAGSSLRTLDSASSSSVITVARSNVQSRASMPGGGNETRSELDDSEYERRESATEYETSQETFPMADGSGSPALESPPHQQAPLPPTSQQQQQHQQHTVHHPPPSRILTTGSTASRVALPMDGKRRMSLEPPAQGGVSSLDKERSLQSRLTVDTAAAVSGASVAMDEYGAQGKNESDTVTLTEEEEAVVREMIGGVTGADDWSIIVYLATMVDVYERSKDPVASGSSEP